MFSLSIHWIRLGLLSGLLLLCGAVAAPASPQPEIHLTIGAFTYVLHQDRLRIMDGQDAVFDVCLSPTLDGQRATIQSWKQTGDNSYEADLGRFGKAFVRESQGRLAYWVETPIKQFDRVTYLSDGDSSGGVWRTFVSDEYERLWDKNVDTNIPISSAYDGLTVDPRFEDGGMTDPDEAPPSWIWNVHVHAWAIKGHERWLGISMPAPWPIGVMRLKMHKGRFELAFDLMRPAASGGKMPAIYFCPGLADGFDALDQHRELSDALGLTDLKPVKHPTWWSNPIYNYWDEWEREASRGQINGQSTHVLNTMQGWLKQVQDRTDYKSFNLTFEQYCFRKYGDYQAAPALGTNEEVRAALESWRRQDIHAGHYYNPVLVNRSTELYRKHPGIFCKPKDPKTRTTWSLEEYDGGADFALVDWTNPEGRQVMLDQIDYLLSSAPGCRDFDILKSNNWHSPDPRLFDFQNPDWGVGDLMTFKIQQLIYERAKKVKPDCLVSKYNALEPYMQPTLDIVEICEDFTSTTDFWWRRGQLITRCLRNRLMYTSAWFVTRSKWNEYFTSILAWGLPETMAVTETTHPYYPQWRPLHDLHYRRRKSGVQVYLNARQESSDECHVIDTPERFEVYRKKTVGPLAGWYGALALSRRCWVTYSEHEARVGATETRTTWVPLPPHARLEKVTRVLHDGHEQPCDHKLDAPGNRIKLYVEDCGGDVLYYRIAYQLIP